MSSTTQSFDQIQFLGTNTEALAELLENKLVPSLFEKLSTHFQPKEPEVLLTRSQVCTLLDINISTLSRWTKEGVLPYTTLGNRVYIKRTDLEAKLKENQIG